MHVPNRDQVIYRCVDRGFRGNLQEPRTTAAAEPRAQSLPELTIRTVTIVETSSTLFRPLKRSQNRFTKCTIEDFRRYVQETFDAIDGWCRYGTLDFYTGLEAAELAEEARRHACRFGYDMKMTPARTPQERCGLWAVCWRGRPLCLIH